MKSTHIAKHNGRSHKPMLTKTCHRACLSANADFTDTKKTKSFKDRENGMTELKNYLKPLTDKNAQLLTCGIFYCRVSANLKGCGSLQTSSWLDSDVLRNRQQKHTANRYHRVQPPANFKQDVLC